MRWKHCIFDLYGTLVDIRTDEWDPALWQWFGQQYLIGYAIPDVAKLRDAWFQTIREREETLRRTSRFQYPEIVIEEVFQKLLRERGVEAGLDVVEDIGWAFRRRSTHLLRLYPGALELLEALRRAGKKVWLLTNAQRIFTRPELKQLGLTDCFDGIYISSERGCRKPDPAFYRMLLEEQGISPREAIMVGNDGRCDVEGARAVGLSTLYLRSEISPKEPLPAADFVFPSMDLAAAGAILLEQGKVPDERDSAGSPL